MEKQSKLELVINFSVFTEEHCVSSRCALNNGAFVRTSVSHFMRQMKNCVSVSHGLHSETLKQAPFRTVYHYISGKTKVSSRKLPNISFFFFFLSLQLTYFQRYITYIYFRLSQASNYGAIEKKQKKNGARQPAVGCFVFQDKNEYVP